MCNITVVGHRCHHCGNVLTGTRYEKDQVIIWPSSPDRQFCPDRNRDNAATCPNTRREMNTTLWCKRVKCTEQELKSVRIWNLIQRQTKLWHEGLRPPDEYPEDVVPTFTYRSPVLGTTVAFTDPFMDCWTKRRE